ncbi:MAG: biotin-dependent carboxyltransferase family protein [Propioniciclava sp.]
MTPQPAGEVMRVGASVLLQDAGRPGFAALGVSPSGAADRQAHTRANRLVGNRDAAATLEVVLGGLMIRAQAAMIVAVTGAATRMQINGEPAAYAAPLRLRPGDLVELRPPDIGLRSYLAVAGGWEAPLTLGSRSTDTLAHLGPPPVVVGTILSVGTSAARTARATAVAARPLASGTLTLEMLPGPRTNWLRNPARLMGPWMVSNQLDRVGVRLEGTPLRRADSFADAELPSEGVVRGAVQVPPSGLPVIFGPDHPVTGGYPVVGVLTRAARDAVAQARPGQLIQVRGPESWS